MRAPVRRSRIRTWWRTGRRRRKNSSCWSRFAARCRTRCSASPSCRRCRMDRGRTGRCCARRRNCCRSRVARQGRQAAVAERRGVHRSNSCSTSRHFSRITRPSSRISATIGIEADIRLIDAVQYRARVEDFDFDMTIERLSMSATPGDSLRPYFSSQAAATKGSYNLAGVANPAIDALIEKVIGAETRADLTDACRALDRVFRAGRYWVPQWYRATHPIAYWDVFGHPEKPPKYAQGVGAPENLVVRRRQGRETRAGEIVHERLYRPPHFPDDPDAARNPVRVLCGGAVRAGRAGGARDRAAQRRRHRRHLEDFGRRRRFRPARPGRRVRRCRRLEISRRAGARSGFHQEPRKAVRLRQAGAGTLRADAVEFRALRFRQELFSRRQRAATDQGEAAGLDVARHLDDAPDLSDLDPARHSQGGARTARGSTPGPRP